MYAPPLNIRILDKRAFGQLPMVGVHVIKTLQDFHVDPAPGMSSLVRAQDPKQGKGTEKRDGCMNWIATKRKSLHYLFL